MQILNLKIYHFLIGFLGENKLCQFNKYVGMIYQRFWNKYMVLYIMAAIYSELTGSRIHDVRMKKCIDTVFSLVKKKFSFTYLALT